MKVTPVTCDRDKNRLVRSAENSELRLKMAGCHGVTPVTAKIELVEINQYQKLTSK